MWNSLLHPAEGYDWEADFGQGGQWLRELIGWYKFGELHESFKTCVGRDVMLSGLAGAVLLLHWGDLAAAQMDWSARADDWRELARHVRDRFVAEPQAQS